MCERGDREWRSELRHMTQVLYSHDVNVSRNSEVLILKVEITTHLWILDKNDTCIYILHMSTAFTMDSPYNILPILHIHVYTCIQ